MSDPTQHLGLLILDLQDSLLKAIPDSDRLLKRCAFAVEAAASLQCSIAVTEQTPEKLGATSSTVQALLPAQTPVFSKDSFSALASEGFNQWVRTNQIEHLLLIGVETSICIYQTAVQALSADIGVTLLADCISERRAEDRQPVLQQLLSMDAHVLPSETIFYSLLGDATHPEFRAFNQLVTRYS